MEKTVESLPEERCTGCGACRNACPFGAICMELNSEGFFYPVVQMENCIGCGKCRSVCPELNRERTEGYFHPEGKCLAAMAADEKLRLASSSGGMFSLLAEEILESGGAVCGAVYAEDSMSVHHAVIEHERDLAPLRGSKYVESDTQEVYSRVRKILQKGRKVLFTGCPCQVAGLYAFLGGDDRNLFTVDLVCHGANSVTAYQSFIRELSEGKKIREVNFRDKNFYGWSTPTVIYFEDGSVYHAPYDKSRWHIAFCGIINRKCCGTCRYAQRSRIGDITLGDFWQIHRYKEEYNDWKGTSLVLVNTGKGSSLFDSVKSRLKLCEEVPLDFAVKYNGQLTRPNKTHPGRRYFFQHLPKDGFDKSLWYGQKYRYDVGLVGWWFAANYGSVMTYYALGKILEDMDLLAIMVRIPQRNNHRWEPVTWENEKFMEKYFPLTKERKFGELGQCNNFCDAFMLGSDQLWIQGYVKQLGYTFFLDFAGEDKKKIAYATSLGHDSYDGTREEKEVVKAYLEDFDAISVRETSGVQVCRESFGIEVTRKLDPVFVCDVRHYDELAANASMETPERYLLCYILDPTEGKKAAVRYLEEKLGLKSLVILDMKTYEKSKKVWGGDNVVQNGSIENFVKLIRNCSFLVSDSHHGICFGLIYHKNFICIANRTRGYARFTSLFDLLDIREHMVDEPEEVIGNDRLLKDVDYEKVDAVLKREKEEALIWLREALFSEKKEKDPQNRKLIRTLNRLHEEEEKSRKLKAEVEKLKDENKRLKEKTGKQPAKTGQTKTEKQPVKTGQTKTEKQPAKAGQTKTEKQPAKTGEIKAEKKPAKTGETKDEKQPAEAGQTKIEAGKTKAETGQTKVEKKE